MILCLNWLYYLLSPIYEDNFFFLIIALDDREIQCINSIPTEPIPILSKVIWVKRIYKAQQPNPFYAHINFVTVEFIPII